MTLHKTLRGLKKSASAFALLLLTITSCTGRSTRATNTEDLPATAKPTAQALEDESESASPTIDIAPAPQQTQNGPSEEEAQKLFDAALIQQNDAAFTEAAKLWNQYLNRHPGMPGFDQAQYNLARCLFFLGRPAEAIEPLQLLIQGTHDSNLAINSRLLLAECLLAQNRYDEAIALTFEVLPNPKLEKKMGLKRARNAVGISAEGGIPSYAQKVKLYTLRGRIFASLKNQPAARMALHQAQILLDSTNKTQLSQLDRRFLTANHAWRTIEVISLSCRYNVPVPERLSEAEFLAYADAYYDCAAPARPLFCKVLAAHDEQIRSQALTTYRALAELPKELAKHLPAPAREIRKQEQRSHYESEMKLLIENTVQARTKDYRNLPSCNAYDVF